jgi:hypothetical protein
MAMTLTKSNHGLLGGGGGSCSSSVPHRSTTKEGTKQTTMTAFPKVLLVGAALLQGCCSAFAPTQMDGSVRAATSLFGRKPFM